MTAGRFSSSILHSKISIFDIILQRQVRRPSDPLSGLDDHTRIVTSFTKCVISGTLLRTPALLERSNIRCKKIKLGEFHTSFTLWNSSKLSFTRPLPDRAIDLHTRQSTQTSSTTSQFSDHFTPSLWCLIAFKTPKTLNHCFEVTFAPELTHPLVPPNFLFLPLCPSSSKPHTRPLQTRRAFISPTPINICSSSFSFPSCGWLSILTSRGRLS